MTSNHLTPDIVTYNTLMAACQSALQWLVAFQLFHDMQENGLQADSIAINSLLAACGSSKQWQAVLSMAVDQGGLQPSVVTFGVAMNACGGAEHWKSSFELLGALRHKQLESWKLLQKASDSAAKTPVRFPLQSTRAVCRK